MNSATYFYIAPEGSRFGPAALDQLTQWAARGFITPKSSLEDVENGQMLVARDVPGLNFESVAVTGPTVSNYPRPPALETAVANGMLKSILAFFFGSYLFGAFAIVSSVRVDKMNREARYDEARVAAQRADMWSNVSFIIAGVCFVLLLALRMLHPAK